MIKTKDLFKNFSGIFSKKTDPSSVTSISMFDSKISKINLILNSSENVQGSIISELAIPAAKTEPHVHTKPESPIYIESKPSVHDRFKPPVSLNTEPLIHTKPEPPVHDRFKPPVSPNTEPPIHTQTEPLVQNSTDLYKKRIQDINKLKLHLEQMDKSRKASFNKYR